MTIEEENIIKQFVAGDESLRAQAIAIHRAEIERIRQARGTPEMDFMAEVDNPVPDYLLRGMYRKKLLESRHES